MIEIKSVWLMLVSFTSIVFAGYWSHKIVDVEGDVGADASICLDAKGNPHISYHDNTNGDLKYATKIGSSWSIEAVETTGTTGQQTSICVDANGNPHISYSYDQNGHWGLKYARKSGGSWTIMTIDTAGAGASRSICIDANGNPHIGYASWTNTLKYARMIGGSWSIESYGTADYGGALSFDLDANGNPAFSYRSGTTGYLICARKIGSVWYKETVDTDGGVDEFTSISLDANGNPHIGYYDGDYQDLKYATKIGNSWTIDRVDSINDVGKYASIALDANGNPHISYQDNTNLDLKYAKKDGSSWTIETVDGSDEVGAFASIGVDVYGNPHICYQRTSSESDLWYTSTRVEVVYPNGGEVWSSGEPQTVRWDGAGEIDIYLSTDGGNSFYLLVNSVMGGAYTITVPNIVTDAAMVKVVRDSAPYSEDLSNACFTIQSPISVRKSRKMTVDDATGSVGYNTSIALDANGNPHISYCYNTGGDLKYAKKIGSSWIIETVDATNSTGYYTSIALDANSNPHISYYYNTGGDLKYAKKIGSSWFIETVDATNSVGTYSSIALDANGNPHLSYCDLTNGDLRYAKTIGSSWILETVDAAGSVGYYTSIALDANGNPHISYFDNTDLDLRYAKKIGSSWIIETVDAIGSVGWYSALALDINANPHISYQDATNLDLKYAKKGGSSWILETVDATGSVGTYTSIALDANGNPHLSYYDLTNGDLRYAKKIGSSWIIETIDATGSVGTNGSIAIDANANPHISYYDQTNGDLKYTTTALNVLNPRGGETWNVGANATVRWAGPRDVDAYVSLQGGDDWTLLLNNIAGTLEADSFNYSMRVPHFPTRFARLKLVYAGFDPDATINYSASDSFFTIQSTIALLAFNAMPDPEGGVQLSWQTEPGVPDLMGYNLYYRYGSNDEPTKINNDLLTDNHYHDTEMRGGLVTYQLGAVNGWNKEYIVGEVSLANFDKPLVILPSMLKGVGMVVFDVPRFTSTSSETEVNLSIFNVLGIKVKNLANGKYSPGFHTVHFDGKDEKGNMLPNGTYFIIMQTPKYSKQTKFIKLK